MLTTLGILLVMCLFSVALYMNIEQKMISYEYNNSNNLLQQIKFNIETVEGIIKAESVRTFFNSDVTNLMYMDKNIIDSADYIERVNNITKDVVIDKFVYSLYLYNNNHKKVLPVIKINPPYTEDMEFIKSIEAGKIYPKLKPIIRELKFSDDNIGKKSEKIITYFMYQSIDKNHRMDGAVIINIKSDWLMGNIKQINSIGKNENVYIIDEDGNFINADSSDGEMDKVLKNKMLGQPLKQKTGMFKANIKGNSYFITYTSLENSSLILAKTQPVSVVYKNIDSIKKTIIIVAIVFLLVAVIISVTVSGRIYKPFRNLMDRVAEDDRDFLKAGAESKDEMLYLEKVYSESMEKIKDFDRKSIFNKNITKSYWLQRCLTEGIALDRQKYDELARENGLQITNNGYLCVLILKIDDYLEFINKNDLMNRNLIKFAVMNIAGEVISEKFLNESIDLGNDHIALIINATDDKGKDCFNILGSLVGKAQEYIHKYYGISVTASASNLASGISNLPGLYSMAVANSVYRFVFGKASYITSEKIDSIRDTKNTNFLEKHETKLMEFIRNKNVEKSMKELFDIISFLKGQDYDIIFLSIVRLTDNIKNVIEQTSGMLPPEKRLLYSDMLKKITTLETIDEFYIFMDNYLKKSLISTSEQDIDPRNALIVETVKEIILSKYNESGLCLQQIAEMLKLQPRRLSSIFKEKENISINEYINEVRLVKVTQMLETSRLNVNEIIEKVGIDNETYFYSIFRKKYGMTPKEYAIQKNLNNLLSNSSLENL